MGKGSSGEHFNIKVQPITDIKHDLYSGRMQAGGPALAFCQHKMHRHKLLPASVSVRAHPSALIIYVCEPFSLSIEIVNIIQLMVESTNLDVCLCKISEISLLHLLSSIITGIFHLIDVEGSQFEVSLFLTSSHSPSTAKHSSKAIQPL